ncbi:peptidase M61 [Nonlabens spongiae]|uniref:Peptidase M61 n=1 Tax=Nonlabens spongiae TaxID=331648 RepID=A0A1W6MK20_9FLAO|nr:peptidase M61 [Nonlabens spongiae]ARN77958.1 peptidase M61 [Nonlabens spongiae]
MKYVFSSVLAILLLTGCSSTKQKKNDLATANPIMTSMDLTMVVNDKLPVTINPGRFTQDMVTYRLPRVVQGTYSVSDFGKYVDDLVAYDYTGKEMAVNRADDNTWTVANAQDLDYITYLVNDTFDIEQTGGIGNEQPFSPSGTNIEDSNYVLNLHGFIGYFDSLKNNAYNLDVTAPADFVRTSALQEVATSMSEDGSKMTTSYRADRYFDITDNPMMYGKLDVEEFMVGDIKIVLSVYSPNGTHTAASQKDNMFKTMQAQKAYLGDINSTARYDIYLYLSDGSETAPKGFGALEHHTSTVVVLPEMMDSERLASSMTDVVAHEFFHIVTPLSVHSEDVHYFDYNQPTFSKHLWMYEGVTEYFAQHFQVAEGLVTPDEFYQEIMGKIASSMNYDDAMSFTTMSENILEEPYKDNYINVYSKGALIGMCIDIMMREESHGNRSMLSLMKELSTKYGKDKPFADDSLIEEITKMTYPSIGEFLRTHVAGDTPIDYEKFFNKAGLMLAEEEVETTYIFAGGQNIIFDADRERQLIKFSAMALENSFWREQKVQADDIILKINGSDLNLANAQTVIGQVFQWKAGDEITYTIERDGKKIERKATLTTPMATSKSLVEDPDATAEQIAVRKAWLNI